MPFRRYILTLHVEMSRDHDKSECFHVAAIACLDGLYGFAMTLTRNSTEAQDLVQETYLQAALAEHRPSTGDHLSGNNLKAWLFTIMRNLWLNQLRHQHHGPQLIGLDSVESLEQRLSDVTNEPQVVHLRIAECEAVRAAIERLPPLYREVVVLRDIEGFSYKEIAEILACPAGTVMSRLGRARERLKQWLSEWHTEPEQETPPGSSSKYESL